MRCSSPPSSVSSSGIVSSPSRARGGDLETSNASALESATCAGVCLPATAPGAAAAASPVLVLRDARPPDLLPVEVRVILRFFLVASPAFLLAILILRVVLVLVLVVVFLLVSGSLLVLLFPLVLERICPTHPVVPGLVFREDTLGGDAHEALSDDQQDVGRGHEGPFVGRLALRAARSWGLRGEERQMSIAAALGVLAHSAISLQSAAHICRTSGSVKGAAKSMPRGNTAQILPRHFLAHNEGLGPSSSSHMLPLSFLSASFSSFERDHTRTFNLSWNSRQSPISGNCIMTACQFPRTQSLCRLASARVPRFNAHKNCARNFFFEQSPATSSSSNRSSADLSPGVELDHPRLVVPFRQQDLGLALTEGPRCREGGHAPVQRNGRHLALTREPEDGVEHAR
eukprot:CAMPEP_0177242512 /NCGR_PEP_ID=MMETSP0367-20130122/48851_1 /TAXON_ID=447022 ORGANISM="Scrippsiella hangoei-like, Strain SHHI-4" /NCGR_SAMPLE_ID=MMETSP0367 /ASSEMBLY_ACC=CAM_ASM_000362 /LENGTH=400 /DNA_ID=CAMNT_0018694141 /DNA_START=331 /DNA_END=1532 /DNA_ORIENTATION=-